MHTDHPLKVERLLNQILEFSSVHYLFLSALVDPMGLILSNPFVPPLTVYMGPDISTNRLDLGLNIVPSSEITKFNDASLHQSSKSCPTHIPCNRGTVVIGRQTDVDFIVCYLYTRVPDEQDSSGN